MTPNDETEATGPAPTAYSGSSKQGDSVDSTRPIAAVTARVESIVDAAEQVAREIRVEAESDALVYAQAKREEVDRMIAAHHKELAGLCVSLTRQTEALQKEIGSLAAQIEGLTPPGVQAPQAAAPRTQPAPLPRPSDEPRDDGQVRETEAAPRSSAPPASPVAAEKVESASPAAHADAPADESERPRPRFAVPFRREKAPAAESEEKLDADEARPSSLSPADPGPTAADRRDPDAAILMATQMAVAGSSRAEVRTALLREFDPGDTERAMLEVLGPEGLS